MAATSTFSISLTEGAWTLIADGATYDQVGVQMDDSYGIRVAIAASSPAVSTEDYISLGNPGDRSFFIDLQITQKIYGQSAKGATRLRGYRRTL